MRGLLNLIQNIFQYSQVILSRENSFNPTSTLAGISVVCNYNPVPVSKLM